MAPTTLGSVGDVLREGGGEDTEGSFWFGSEARWSYREVREEVDRLAGGVRERLGGGVRSGSVAVLARSAKVNLLWLLAAPRAGLVVVPLNVRWSEEETAHALRDCQADVLVFDASCQALVERLRRRREFLPLHLIFACRDTSVDYIAQDDLWTRSARDALQAIVAPEEYGVFYTSGTSGRSKGVVLTHANFLVQGHAKIEHVGYSARTVYLHLVPLFHVGGASSAIAVAMAKGTHVLPESTSFSAPRVLELVDRLKVTAFAVVPAMLQMLVAAAQSPASTARSFRHVDTILVGGGAMDGRLRAAAKRVFPGARLTAAYGMTETASSLTFLDVTNVEDDSASFGCVGTAPAHVELQIVSADGEQLPSNGVGMIVTRGAHVMKEYLHLPRETHAVLHDGWLRTGDLGCIDETGQLFLKGRRKDMVKSAGENVYAAEVEMVLLRHPMVKDCAMFGLPDLKFGEIVCVAIELPADVKVTAVDREALKDELFTVCGDHLSRYKVPKQIFFAKSLPRNSNGKVLKDQLKRQLQASL